MPGFHLDDIWPGVTDNAWVSLLMYLVVFDLVEYWIHRGQHGFAWWWKLHAVHHSQRQMTVWSDNRNHLLDDVIHDAIIVLVAQLIGVAPGQFVAIVALTQLSESFQHANAHLVWPTGRAPVDQSRAFTAAITPSVLATNPWRPCATRRCTATTSAYCCPGGTYCLVRPTLICAMTPLAFAIRCKRMQKDNCATMAVASGRSSGWLSCD
jgi:hypothetical protein